MSNYTELANDGPWKCIQVGHCGDIIDTRINKLYGSLLYTEALETVRQLNQRWRLLRKGQL